MKLLTVLVAGIMALGLISSGFAETTTITPLALSQRDIGGGALNQYTPGVEGGRGLNNIGLLIKTWGKVTSVDETNKYFYIDDGSKLSDGSNNVGLRVSYDNLAPGNTITPPVKDSYVTVVGICSTFLDANNKIHPNFRPRYDLDIQLIKPAGS